MIRLLFSCLLAGMLTYTSNNDFEEFIDDYDNEAAYEEYEDMDEYYSDYDDYDDYEDADYLTDREIMDKMVTLCDYLVDKGTIDNFSIELDYSARGDVRGTVCQDDDYVYVLYDNGEKEDENGNDCLELVLEAEPLDENGNSLGQTEAVLKGFYLVNLETDEVIDEHKTSW